MVHGKEEKRMNVKELFAREFALDVCARFAGGESIAEIADSSGNTIEEIEELLKAYHAEMAEAFHRAGAVRQKAKAASMGREADALERIAAALEQLAEIFEHRKRKGE